MQNHFIPPKNYLPHQRATKELLDWYTQDLNHFASFLSWKHEPAKHPEYEATFKRFLSDFRVLRWLGNKNVHSLLDNTIAWINGPTPDDVDGFAAYLERRGVTPGKVMTSMASKVLFLNNPHQITPIDSYVRAAVHLQSNRYADYLPLFQTFVQRSAQAIESELDLIDSQLSALEKPFENRIPKIKGIRRIRYADKLLWAIGLPLVKK